VAEVPGFDVLMAQTRRSAVHLEMRDSYGTSDPQFLAWLAGDRADPTDPDTWWPMSYYRIVTDATGRGVRVRRARIISEPITDYIRFEYDVTFANIAVGEQVRWLPRRRASDLALPGNDFWLFDDRLVRFGHFAGDGEFLCHELTEEPTTVKLCGSAFEAAWERATPHEDYRPPV
jgi:hypothetical protein